MGHFSGIAIEMETLLLSGEYEMNEPPFAIGDDEDDFITDDQSDAAWDYFANMCFGR